VEIIERLHRALPDDFAEVVRDDEKWRAWIGELAPFFHPDWETVRRSAPGSDEAYVGFDGSRALWLSWVAPWQSYRIVFERAIDCGERVISFSHDHARPWDSTREVALPAPAGVWTFRDGKIARFDIYEDRTEAVKAGGWRSSRCPQT
jgi:hypothetical protein